MASGKGAALRGADNTLPAPQALEVQQVEKPARQGQPTEAADAAGPGGEHIRSDHTAHTLLVKTDRDHAETAWDPEIGRTKQQPSKEQRTRRDHRCVAHPLQMMSPANALMLRKTLHERHTMGAQETMHYPITVGTATSESKDTAQPYTANVG